MSIAYGCFKPLMICKHTGSLSNNSKLSSATSLSLTSSSLSSSHALDATYIKRAAELADKSAGFTAPHPNFGCVITTSGDRGNVEQVVGEGYLYAEGTTPAEMQAVEIAGEFSRGATAYLNMEPGDFYADRSAVSSLVKAGISRVVIGIRHPLQHLRGNAIDALRGEGLQVDVFGEDLQSTTIEEALKSCLDVNAPLLYRAANRVPFSVLKYAMTLDGKIAASSGHSLWISSQMSRSQVLELRGRSNAVIVGGNTVRKDNPRLTARNGNGHTPTRIILSPSFDLPDEAHLWDVHEAPTIIATQKGANVGFQNILASKGVQVVEFNELNPRNVAEYLYNRGYLSLMWECGGTLAASAISSNVIHKIHAYVAPKIIGGKNALSPVGELGMVEMTQALELKDVQYQQVGPDILVSGFLQPIPDMTSVIPLTNETSAITSIISINKTWEPYGVFSNFSPHPITMPDENGTNFTWPTVEHYYQAQKFKFTTVYDPLARNCLEDIKHAKSPEEAVRFGKLMESKHPDLVRSDWEEVKFDIMYKALKCKFTTYTKLYSMLISSERSVLIDGGRLNFLGRLLMKLRSEFLDEVRVSQEIENELGKL